MRITLDLFLVVVGVAVTIAVFAVIFQRDSAEQKFIDEGARYTQEEHDAYAEEIERRLIQIESKL